MNKLRYCKGLKIGQNLKIKFLLFIALPMFFIPLSAFSQADCELQLKEAVEKYNQGMYQQVLDILVERIETCKFSKSEKEQAQKLVIASYLELDELEKGSEAAVKFLRKNPNYAINSSTDPVMFIDELLSYRVSPKFKIGLNIGVNKLMPIVLVRNYVWESADYLQAYDCSFAPSINLGFEWMMYKNFSLKTGVNNLYHSYERNITAYTDFKLNYAETFNELQIPIELKYAFNYTKNWSPYVFAGAYFTQVLNPLVNITINDISLSTGTIYSHEEKSVSMANYRNLSNFGYYGGLGLNYSMNKLTFSIQSLLISDIRNFTNNSNSAEINQFLVDYYYIDDVVRFQSWQIGFGVAYTFSYQIKKKY